MQYFFEIDSRRKITEFYDEKKLRKNSIILHGSRNITELLRLEKFRNITDI